MPDKVTKTGGDKRRSRKHTSCLPCAKGKRKCCKQFPCTNCKIRGIQCVYDNGRVMHISGDVPAGKDAITDRPQYSSDTKLSGCTSSNNGEMSSSGAKSGGTPAQGTAQQISAYQVSSQAGADFVIRMGQSHQRTFARYYGPTSGPSLLLSHTLYKVEETDAEPFPRDSISNLDSLLQCYYDNMHWVISCIEWSDITSWLESSNVPEINALLYTVLALSAAAQGYVDQSELLLKYSTDLVPDVTYSPSTSRSHWSLVLRLLRIYLSDMRGQREEMWQQLGLAISTATSMGYHRNWSFPCADGRAAQAQRSRLWYSLLALECKLSLALGRPYMVRSEAYDCEMPESAPYSYETSFRDAINSTVPLYRTLLDELFSRSPSFERLMDLDMRVSHWMMEITHELHPVNLSLKRMQIFNGSLFTYSDMPSTGRDGSIGSSNSSSSSTSGIDSAPNTAPTSASGASTPVSTAKPNSNNPPGVPEDVLDSQRLFINVNRVFLRSRIHRAFLESENPVQRAYCAEQYCISSREFFPAADMLFDMPTTMVLQDAVAFTVDNALFYGIKVSKGNQTLFRDTTERCVKQFNYLLDKATRFSNCPAGQLARNGRHILDNLTSPSDVRRTDMMHPLEECDRSNCPAANPAPTPPSSAADSLPAGNGEASIPVTENGLIEPIQGLGPGVLPTAFEVSDWDQWLRSMGVSL